MRFVLGVQGVVVNRRNILVMVMSIELMRLALNLILITASTKLGNLMGSILALYILVVAAAESAIALSILVAFYRVRGTIAVKFINFLRG
jgi:NADH-quinone oxidoreductase subunit K